MLTCLSACGAACYSTLLPISTEAKAAPGGVWMAQGCARFLTHGEWLDQGFDAKCQADPFPTSGERGGFNARLPWPGEQRYVVYLGFGNTPCPHGGAGIAGWRRVCAQFPTHGE